MKKNKNVPLNLRERSNSIPVIFAIIYFKSKNRNLKIS